MRIGVAILYDVFVKSGTCDSAEGSLKVMEP